MAQKKTYFHLNKKQVEKKFAKLMTLQFPLHGHQSIPRFELIKKEFDILYFANDNKKVGTTTI